MEFLAQWGCDAVQARLRALTARLAEGLRDCGVMVPDTSVRAPHILSLRFPAGMPEGLIERLAAEQIYVAPRVGRLRISPHVYNDEDDVDRFVRPFAGWCRARGPIAKRFAPWRCVAAGTRIRSATAFACPGRASAQIRVYPRSALKLRKRVTRLGARAKIRDPGFHGLPGSAPPLLPQVLVEEARDLAERLLGLRRIRVEVVLRVRHALEHLQLRLHAGATELAVGQNGQAQEQVARAAGENGRRETAEVAVDRRKLRILEVVSVGVQ